MTDKFNPYNAQLESLSCDEYREIMLNKISSQRWASSTHEEGDHILNQHIENEVMKKAVKPAAVLIAVVERQNGLHVVFTKRTEKLRSHSGQVSFPGGKIDASDENAIFAALRETHEEIGVGSEHVQVLGQFAPYHSGSGYLISPVAGIIDARAEFNANADEVDYIFEVPLAFLMNPDNHEIQTHEFDKVEWQYYQMIWGKHRIWGVTAGMVRMFYNRIFK